MKTRRSIKRLARDVEEVVERVEDLNGLMKWRHSKSIGDVHLESLTLRDCAKRSPPVSSAGTQTFHLEPAK
jgi:hypothetical protein